MPETEERTRSSLLDSLRKVIQDGVDYFLSAVTLLQARMTGMALSAFLFVAFAVFAGLLGLTSFILLTIAFGMWLTQLTGHAGWSLVILSTIYALLAVLAGFQVSRWIHKLNR